jgi:hypothetical protein
MSLRPGKIIRVRIFAAWLFFCPRTGYVAPRIVAVRLRVISAQPARYPTACKDPKQGYIVFAARGLSRNRRSYRIGIIVKILAFARIDSNRHVSMLLTPIASRCTPQLRADSPPPKNLPEPVFRLQCRHLNAWQPIEPMAGNR